MSQDHLPVRQESSPEFMVPVSHDRVTEAKDNGSVTFPLRTESTQPFAPEHSPETTQHTGHETSNLKRIGALIGLVIVSALAANVASGPSEREVQQKIDEHRTEMFNKNFGSPTTTQDK